MTESELSREAAFLRLVPVLADLPDQQLEQLAAGAARVTVSAGEWLFREGDAADNLYVVRSGRFEAVAEGPPEVSIRELHRGEVLGELALLREESRSLSVRARRDGVLLAVSRAQFEDLIYRAPGFALGLTRSLGAQLAASRMPPATSRPPRSIAVVGLDERAPTEEVATLLLASLRRLGSTAELRATSSEATSEALTMLDNAERASERTVLIGAARHPGDAWTDLCIAEAERVLAISGGGVSPEWLARPEVLRGCDLLVVGSVLDEGAIAALDPREMQIIAAEAELPARLAATARRLAGRSVGLALSGGGARAFAHIGVIEEFMDAGLPIDRIGAVSMGAVVGAGYACEFDSEAITRSLRESFVDRNPTSDYVLPLYSLVRGGRTRELIRSAFGGRRIEALGRRYFSVSCDLLAREVVYHRSGSLEDAVRASLCIPGIFPPIPTRDGRLLIDGGVLENLPVERLARSGEGPVIAVDVTNQREAAGGPRRRPLARFGPTLRRWLTGSETAIPRLGETMMRTVALGSIDTAAAAKQHASLVIQPAVEGVGLLDWAQLEQARAAGRAAARAALEEAPPGLFPSP